MQEKSDAPPNKKIKLEDEDGEEEEDDDEEEDDENEEDEDEEDEEGKEFVIHFGFVDA